MSHSGKSSKEKMTPKEIAMFSINGFNAMKGDDNEYMDCPICLNRKSIAFWDEENERESSRTCECVPKRLNIRRIRKSGLSKVMESRTFEKYICENDWQKKLKERTQNNIASQKWFFIGGQTGIGKSHLCTALCIDLINNNVDVHYMLWRDEISKIKANVNENTYFDKLDYLKKIKVLYIDDFFKSEQGKLPTQADINIAYELINYRYNENLKTIISTELMISQILEIDGAIGGRITEMCTKEFCISIHPDKTKNMRIRGFGFSI